MKKTLFILLCVAVFIGVLSSATFAADSYEYALFPGSVIYVTQGAYGEYGSYSHNGQGGYYQNAFDLAGNNNYFAPFSGTIKKIKTSYNAVVLQSDNKVHWANGVLDYMTVCFVHDNNISDLYVGKHINQGEIFYQPGTKDPGGYTTGTHLHLAVKRGGSSSDVNSIINIFSGDTRPNDAFFRQNSTKINQSGNYSWTKLNQPTANTYTVKYDANGGSGTMSNTKMTYGTSTALRKNTFTRTGYTFKGWNAYRASDNTWRYRLPDDADQYGWYKKGSQPSGYILATLTDEGKWSKLTSANGDTITMYAVWEANTYTVKYNANGGNGTMSNTKMTYGTSTALRKNTLTRTGYTFKGWNAYRASDNTWRYRLPDDADTYGWYKKGSQPSGYILATLTDEGKWSKLTAVNGDTITMYAVWKANK